VVLQPKSGPGCLIVDVSRSHTIRHITPGRTPLNERSAHRRGRCLNKTQETQEMNFHALNEMLIRDPRNRADVDLRRRPYGHRDWQTCTLIVCVLKSFFILWVRFSVPNDCNMRQQFWHHYCRKMLPSQQNV
jgi:hypothetical protein